MNFESLVIAISRFIGMGSSYFAALTYFYAGILIHPFLASEYYEYLTKSVKPEGVLISQSEESFETVWNTEKFEKIIAISNNAKSSLAQSPNTEILVELCVGEE